MFSMRTRASAGIRLAAVVSLSVLAVACGGAAASEDAAAGAAAATAPQCAFGATFADLSESTSFEKVKAFDLREERVLSATEQEIALAGIRAHRPEATNLGEGMGMVDDGQVNYEVWKQKSTGKQYVSIEYGLGDNSYGAIFDEATKAKVAAIHDGDLEQCTVTVPAAAAPKRATYRKLAQTVAMKDLAATCRALEPKAEDAFYCPKIDRYKFSGPITDEALGRMIERRASFADSLRTVSKAEAVAALTSRARGQVAAVGNAAVRSELEAVLQRYEGLLTNAPGTRFVTASGYWAPSVNSDTVMVVDDDDHTVFVLEHGDTDG